MPPSGQKLILKIMIFTTFFQFFDPRLISNGYLWRKKTPSNYLTPLLVFLRKFLPDFARLKIFTRLSTTQGLHFKPTKSLWADCGDFLQPKNTKKQLKIPEIAPPSVRNEIWNIFYWSPRPIPQIYNRIWEVLLPSQKVRFSAFPPLDIRVLN